MLRYLPIFVRFLFFINRMSSIQALQSFLQTPQKIVVTSHYNPDADALGSALAWGLYLRKKGHEVHIAMPSESPHFLSWMPGIETVMAYEGPANRQQIGQWMAEATLICCLDFSGLGRVNDMENLLRQSQAPKLMVDHHLQPEDFATFVVHDTKAAATCELIYDLIEQLGDKNLIDHDIALCIYAGLMTDTGSFRHPTTTPRSHQIAAEIIDLGVNTNRVHRLIFDTSSYERLQFLGYILTEKTRYLPEYRTVYMTISEAEQRRFHSQTGDTEGIVNYGLQIKDVVMAVLIIERRDGVKLSFRSVEEFAVNTIAKEHFGGGGHKNAAGGKIEKATLVQTEQQLLAILPQYKTQLLAVE
jgi:bifunctional oligoribonuclease and PAP phosphatase NrnA